MRQTMEKARRIPWAALLFALLLLSAASCGGESSGASEPAADGDTETEAEAEQASLWTLPYVAPDRSGPFHVGARAVTFESANYPGRSLSGTIWYPTEATSGDKYYYQTIFLAKGILGNAPLAAGGPFPVVLFSHGNQGFAEQSGFLTAFLASHGFIVAACNHPGNTTGGKAPMWTVAEERPHDLSLTLDQMTAFNADPASPFYGKLSLDKVAAIGHSFGGYTALAIGGATVDPQKAAAACAQSTSNFCSLMGEGATEQMSAQPVLRDERIKGIVALAPGSWEIFGAEGLAQLTIPVMIQHGDTDKTLPIEQESDKIFPAIAGADKHYIRIKGAGHFSFTLMCELAKNFGDGCGEGYLAYERAYVLIDTFTLAKLRLSLFKETRDAHFLSKDYEATLPEILP